MGNRLDEVRTMLEVCIDHERDLSSWEIDFIDNLDTLTKANHILSQKQEDTLEKIYEKYSG